MLAVLVAVLLDRACAQWVHGSGLAGFMKSHRALTTILKLPGEYGFTLVAIAAVSLWHPLRWRAGVFVFLATLLTGVNGLTKWMMGRWRPYTYPLHTEQALPFSLTFFRGGWRGILDGRDLSFPSGHACLAFATAAAVAMLWPRARWRWFGYVIAAIVAAERVAENAHWCSDAVVAAALGVGVASVARAILRVEDQISRTTVVVE
jgi:membrane-associated phospholipid phosphatase